MELPGTDDVDAKSSSVSASTTLAIKSAPPETHQEIRTRRWIILSLWAIIALFGLPAWYATTTVPRADLPLDAMNRWAEGHVCILQTVWLALC